LSGALQNARFDFISFDVILQLMLLCLTFSYSLERTVNQIALDADLTRPAANVMTRDAADDYEMKLLSQAIELSLQDQVSIKLRAV